jgi:cytochrome c oxidase assembly protein subunit 15
LLLWATVESLVIDRPAGRPAPALRAFGWWTWAATGVLLVQVAFGTLVRGQVDAALDAAVPRVDALATVGMLDTTHRELAALVTVAVVALWLWSWLRHGSHLALARAAAAALALVVAQLLAGMALAGLALPPAAQVSHLTLASLLLGALTALALVAWRWPAQDASGAAQAA